MCLVWLLIFITHLYYLSGMWFAIALRMDNKRDAFLNKENRIASLKYVNHSRFDGQHFFFSFFLGGGGGGSAI